MTIRTAYHKTKSELDALYASGEAQAIVDLLFFELLHISRSDLIKNPDEILTDNLMLMLEEKTNELLQYKPIQQVIGKAQFLGFDFIVDSSVLIPRPETEELVLLVEENIVNIVEASILDIGSGSGCILRTALAVLADRRCGSRNLIHGAVGSSKLDCDCAGCGCRGAPHCSPNRFYAGE